MDRTTAVLITLVAYKIILLAIGYFASKRTHSAEDFFIGGKGLGPWVAAVSACASASSAWTLLGASGATYLWGVSMLWLFPGVIAGYAFNWLWMSPKLNKAGKAEQAVTVTEFIGNFAGPYKRIAVLLCSFIIVFSFSFYIASQFQAAGNTFASTFDFDATNAIILGAIIIVIYTLLGGFWAVSLTDTVQGLLMALSAIVLPLFALIEVGGFSGLIEGLASLEDANALSFTGGHEGIVAIGFVLGLMGVALGNPGQPHVVNRFMAIRDEKSLSQAKVIGIVWPIIVFGGMMLLGLCGKVLIPMGDGNNEQVLFAVTNLLFHPVVAGVILAAVLSAIMSTADSQLLVAASSLSYDINQNRNPQKALIISRLTVVFISLVAVAIALYAPKSIFDRVLFAWSALGNAFGPVLIVRLMNIQIKPIFVIAAIFIGFSLTIYFNWQPSPPGDFPERVVPFIVAFIVLFLGKIKR